MGSNRTKIPACLAPKVSVPKAQSQAAYLASTSSHTRPRFHRKAQSVQSPVIPYTRLWVPPRLALALALALCKSTSPVARLEERREIHSISFPGGRFSFPITIRPLPSKVKLSLGPRAILTNHMQSQPAVPFLPSKPARSTLSPQSAEARHSII